VAGFGRWDKERNHGEMLISSLTAISIS
jgi:hypothetical protein